jgi:hypothetical protein
MVIVGEKDRNIYTFPGTIKITEGDYVAFIKNKYMIEGFTGAESIKMAENDFYRLSIKSAERRARNGRKGK